MARGAYRSQVGLWSWPILAVLLMGISGGALAAAPGIAVVVHDPALAAGLDRASLARIYRRWQRIDTAGRPLVPVNLPADAPLRRAFTQALFRQSPEDMRGFWDERYFQGVSPPTVLASPEAVERFVRRTPGALGYLPDCRTPPDLVVALRLRWPRAAGIDPFGLCQEGD